MDKKFLGMLGLARKAGKVLLGYDNIIMQKKPLLLLILSENASERTKRNVENLGKPLIKVDITKAELGKVLGAGDVSVAAITDPGFAKQLSETALNRGL